MFVWVQVADRIAVVAGCPWLIDYLAPGLGIDLPHRLGSHLVLLARRDCRLRCRVCVSGLRTRERDSRARLLNFPLGAVHDSGRMLDKSNE